MKSFKEWELLYGNEKTGYVCTAHASKILEKEKIKSLNVSGVPITLVRKKAIKTGLKPKFVYKHNDYLVVCCMGGKCVEIFDSNYKKVVKINLKGKVIECIGQNNYLYVTSSDLKTPSSLNLLTTINSSNWVVESENYTGGKWSKSLLLDTKQKLLYISNWYSNNISVFDITKPHKPKLIQIKKAGISPRGMALYKDSNLIVGGYYSRNIMIFNSNKNRKLTVKYIGKPLHYPKYSGNVRDVVIKSDFAYFSNMGKNEICKFDLEDKKIKKCITVSKYPCGIIINGNNLYTICSEGKRIVSINLSTFAVNGCSGKLAGNSFSLAMYNDYLVTVCYDKNLLEFFSLVKNKKQPKR